MANSRIGQYLLEYTLTGFGAPVNSHFLRANVMAAGSPASGDLPTAVNINNRGGGTQNLQVTADQVWSYFRLNYPSSITAVSFTLWKWITNTSKQFISAGTLATPAGTGSGTVLKWQTTLTFRGANGGIGKIVMIECAGGGDQRAPLIPNAAGQPTQRIAAFALSSASPFQALDNSFFVAALRDSRGENEAIRNRRVGVS